VETISRLWSRSLFEGCIRISLFINNSRGERGEVSDVQKIRCEMIKDKAINQCALSVHQFGSECQPSDFEVVGVDFGEKGIYESKEESERAAAVAIYCG
jgi:hypothetical protein